MAHGLNYLAKRILCNTLLTHKTQVVDATNMFAHSTVTFAKLRCGTVWTELPFTIHIVAHSPHLSKTGAGCEKYVIALHGHVFKNMVRGRLDYDSF